MHFNIFTWPPFIAACLNFGLCLLVLLRTPRHTMHRTFAALNLCMGIWNINNIFYYTLTDTVLLFHVARWTRDFMICMYAVFFHFALSFTDNHKPLHRRFLQAAYFTTGIFIVTNHIGGLFIQSFKHYYWGYYPVAGPVAHLFGIIFNVYILYSLVLLYQATRAATGFFRHQYRLMFLANMLFFGSAISNFLTVSGIVIYPFGNIGNIAYSLLVAYTVVTYGLLDIQIALREGFVYAGLGTALSFTYLLVVALIKQMFLEHDTRSVHEAFQVAAVPITLSLAPRLKAMMEPLALKVPFWRTHDYKQIVRRVSHRLFELLDIQELSVFLSNEMQNIFNTTFAAVYVRSSDDSGLVRLAGGGPLKSTISFTHPLIERIKQSRKLFIRDVFLWESERRLKPQEFPALEEFARGTWAAVVVPLFARDKLVGMVCLGDKTTKQMYNADDVALIETLAGSMALSLNHARAVYELTEQQKLMERQREMALMGTVVTEMAHELSKPLTHIMNAEASMERASHPQDNLKLIKKEALRASEILDGFAMLSPERTLHRVSIALADLVEEAISTLDLKEDRTVRLVRNFKALPPVPVNPGQIVQVLTNLIQNAWQAMPRGGVLTITVQPSGPSAADILIQDTGSGIAEELREKVFAPFFTTKQELGGRGMGLTISRAMVERHGGTIVLESPVQDNRGTRVIVRLPILAKEDVHDQ